MSFLKDLKIKIYHFLLNRMRKKAGLSYCSIQISLGKIVYLDNKKIHTSYDEAIIMVHGLASNKDKWLKLSQQLKNKYRIILPDLPGHGDSVQELDFDYSINAQAEHLAEFIKALNLDKIHIIGNSLGGAVVTRFTYKYPKLVHSLILMNSYGALKTKSHLYHMAQKLGYNPIIKVHSVEDYHRMMKIAMVKPSYIPNFIIEILVERMIERFKINEKIFFASYKNSNLISLLPHIKQPVLLIWGEKDKILHLDDSRLFRQEIPNCKRIILKDVGHVPMIECPKLTAEYVDEFLHFHIPIEKCF